MSPINFYDRELGWKGKKVFGDMSSRRFKIFFVGDSGTHGHGVKDEAMYYGVVGKILNAEIYAYGGSSYGTLQEYIAIDKYFDEIRPNLIILQTYHNDFIDNSWELVTINNYHGFNLVRPYLIDGRIEYRFPKQWGRFRMALAIHSRIFYSLWKRLDRLFAILAHKGIVNNVYHIIEKEGMNFGPFKKSIAITDTLVKMIKKRASGTPVIAFCYNNAEPYTQQFREIFKANNIDFIESVPKIEGEAEKRGDNVWWTDTGHWNELGNQIAGEALAEEIRKRGYIIK